MTALLLWCHSRSHTKYCS